MVAIVIAIITKDVAAALTIVYDILVGRVPRRPGPDALTR